MKLANVDAEIQSIISVLQSEDEKVRHEILSRLTLKHFGLEESKNAYSLLCKSITDNGSIPTIDMFTKLPGLSESALNLIKNPNVRAIHNTNDVDHLVSILDYHKKGRAAYDLSLKVSTTLSTDSPEMEDVIRNIESTLFEMNEGIDKSEIYHIGQGHNSDHIADAILNQDRRFNIVRSTYENFDSVAGGWGGTDLVGLAAPPKSGKSILALNILIRMYIMNNTDVLYIPLEMDEIESTQRLLSCISGVPYDKIRLQTYSEFEKQNIVKCWQAFQDHGTQNGCRFTIWPPSTLTVSEFKMMVKPFKYKVSCIDYINLMELEGGDRGIQDVQKLNTLGRLLKQATKELGQLIVCPTQLNDDGQIKYGRSLKEHANNVWYWTYDEESALTKQVRINQMVSRSWAPFSFLLEADFTTCNFKDSKMKLSDFESATSVGDNSSKFKKRKNHKDLNK